MGHDVRPARHGQWCFHAGLGEGQIQVTDDECRDVSEWSEKRRRCEHELGIILGGPPIAVSMAINLGDVDDSALTQIHRGILDPVGVPLRDAYRCR